MEISRSVETNIAETRIISFFRRRDRIYNKANEVELNNHSKNRQGGNWFFSSAAFKVCLLIKNDNLKFLNHVVGVVLCAFASISSHLQTIHTLRPNRL